MQSASQKASGQICQTNATELGSLGSAPRPLGIPQAEPPSRSGSSFCAPAPLRTAQLRGSRSRRREDNASAKAERPREKPSAARALPHHAAGTADAGRLLRRNAGFKDAWDAFT